MIKLVCLDMDGVLVEPNNFWMELHEKYGTLEEGKVLTEKYLKTDYERLIQEVIGRLWKDKPEDQYHEVVDSIAFMPGIEEFFAALGDIRRIIISGGSYHLAEKIKERFGIDRIYANKVIFEDGKINSRGEFHWTVGGAHENKARIITELIDEFGITGDNILYVGDSAADLDAFRIVGTSIAFNSESEELRNAATHVVDSSDLRDVIPILDKLLK